MFCRIALIVTIVFFASFISTLAQEKKEEVPQVDLKAKAQVKPTACACLEPGITLVQKAYTSLEEDEWPVAIKSSSDALNEINKISKTCKCPEVAIYQNIAKAYLNYAKAGDLLDGDDEPDCKIAKKLYQDAINWLDASITKVSSTDVSSNAKSIKEYANEELQFVMDECEEAAVPAKEEKSKAASKKN